MPAKRHRPSQAGSRVSNVQPFSVREFFARFPNDEACLEHIMSVRHGGLTHTCAKCGQVATFHRLASRPAYSCARCGAHVYPCAGTVFQDTRTPLTVWFYAIYLFVVTRHGVSGKELQRQLGVTYKTAYRIGMQIRKLIGSTDEFVALKGHVEIDETLVGGVLAAEDGTYRDNKTVVMGLKERGGRIVAEVIPDRSTKSLRDVVLMTVQPKTTITTDEWPGYRLLTRDRYDHHTVNHSQEEWVRWEDGAKHHVAHVESFWKLFKDSVRSTHIHISEKHMQTYLNEFTFRSNHRAVGNAMFDLLIGAL